VCSGKPHNTSKSPLATLFFSRRVRHLGRVWLVLQRRDIPFRLTVAGQSTTFLYNSVSPQARAGSAVGGLSRSFPLVPHGHASFRIFAAETRYGVAVHSFATIHTAIFKPQFPLVLEAVYAFADFPRRHPKGYTPPPIFLVAPPPPSDALSESVSGC